MRTVKHSTREAWLVAAVDELRPLFDEHELPVPKLVRVSCGWPKTSRNGRIGECWSTATSADGVPSVFISPALDELPEVLHVLVHELIHAADDNDSGHKGTFARVARAIGLEGKLTATHAGTELERQLKGVARKLGKYPHGAITPSSHSKQTTRMLKCECPVKSCGYTVRTTQKWLDAYGPPWCPNPEHREVVLKHV